MAVKISTPHKRKHISAIDSRGFVSQVTEILHTTTTGVDTYIAPVRSSILKRFPVLFALLTTFGVSTTFYGFNKLIDQIAILNNNPLLMLIVGMGILTFTGTLYKKLS
jgi:uncharacterized integral membrane protein